MSKHELDLFENAIDSLNEALRKYQEGVEGNFRAFKFAILHFSHFIELLLKHYVMLSHPLFIYKKPFSKNIQKENTIGVWEAVQFLKDVGHDIPHEFNNDLKWFKKLRNDIEHYKFSLDINEVKSNIGRLMLAVNKFNDAVGSVKLKEYVDDPKLLRTFEDLAEEYEARLAAARKKAEEDSGFDFSYECCYCGNDGTTSCNARVYKCHFCGEETEEKECCVCGGNMPESDAIVWNSDYFPHIDYICTGCYDRYLRMTNSDA